MAAIIIVKVSCIMEKIKSRWRKNYLEDNITDKSDETTVTSNNHHKHHHSSKHSSPPVYEPITENLYLDKRKSEHSRSKKDARSMVCDCILTKEERARGVMGCLDDCLNRMLMIECGSKCTLGDHCLNKRFQKCQSAKVEVFKTKKKGWGLRAAADLPAGTFIMEYVGEVVRSKEFRSRVKKYTKQKVKHHYFMALRSDEIIDATCKGNLTRFINHSCEPNCETQKWTVNGDLRIGFFTIKNLQAGDEITFDYQFQRYGRKAQKCYCEAPSCRGYIGGNEQTYSLNGHSSPQSHESKAHKKAYKHGLLVDVTIEDKINALVEDASNGLKTRDQVIALASLSIKAEQLSDRRKLLNIIRATKSDCSLRLFVDYHGLEIVCLWMRDPQADCEFKASIIEILEKLPIPNKTKVVESNVYRMIERWANEEPKQASQAIAETNGTENERNSIDSVDIVKDGDDDTESSQNTPKPKSILNGNTDSQQSTSSSTLPQLQHSSNSPSIKSMATKLLKKFQTLSPGFKIPRLNRLQRMEIEKKMGEEICNDEFISTGKDRAISDTTNPFVRNYFKTTPAPNSLATNNSNALSKLSNDTLPLKRKFDSAATTTPSSTATTTTNNIDLTPAPKLSKKEHREQFELNVKLKDYYDTIEKHYGPIVAEQVKLSHRVLPYLNGFPSLPYPHQLLAGQGLTFPVIPPSLIVGPQAPQVGNSVGVSAASATGPTATQSTNVLYPNIAYHNNYNSVNSSSSTTAQSSPYHANVSYNQNTSGNHHLSSTSIPTLIVLTDHQVEPIDSELAFSLCDYDSYYTQRDKPLESGDVMTKPYPGSYYTTPDGERWFVTVTLDRKSNRPRTIVLPLSPVSKIR